MHTAEQKIVHLFKDNPTEEFSTKDIVVHLYPEFCKLTNYYDFGNRELDAKTKERIAKAQRFILYHLNKLVNEEILVVSRIGNKGKKYFILNLESGEELFFKKNKKRILISKPREKALPINGPENQGLIYRYDAETWTNKVNAILLQSNKFDIQKLNNTLIECFSYVNDAICLNDFEGIIQETDIQEIEKFFYELTHDCDDYRKNVTIIIDLKNIKNEWAIIDCLKKLFEYNTDKITVVFDAKIKHLQDAKAFFEDVVRIFVNAKKRFYIKNKDLHSPPYILGSAGPYTFTEKDWTNYRKYSQPKGFGALCGSSTIVVDVERFFENVGKINEFRKLITNSLKALFIANSIQRANANENFKGLLKLNQESPTEFFSSSRNYIRFWNYGWKQPNKDQQIMLNLIESTKKGVKEFSLTQESIYLACGMPTQFKTAFSCAFEGFTKKETTKKHFNKMAVSSPEELYKEEMAQLLKTKENITKIFDGGDRTRIIRHANKEPKDIVKEIDLMMNLYNIPLLCYDFGRTWEGNNKLTSYM
ncbi:MAG: hypothetical protein ACOCQG_00205 [Candidatus Nanoarchaeia archaeon]